MMKNLETKNLLLMLALFITNPATHKITILDIAARKQSEIISTGKTPDGIAWSN